MELPALPGLLRGSAAGGRKRPEVNNGGRETVGSWKGGEPDQPPEADPSRKRAAQLGMRGRRATPPSLIFKVTCCSSLLPSDLSRFMKKLEHSWKALVHDGVSGRTGHSCLWMEQVGENRGLEGGGRQIPPPLYPGFLWGVTFTRFPAGHGLGSPAELLCREIPALHVPGGL